MFEDSDGQWKKLSKLNSTSFWWRRGAFIFAFTVFSFWQGFIACARGRVFEQMLLTDRAPLPMQFQRSTSLERSHDSSPHSHGW